MLQDEVEFLQYGQSLEVEFESLSFGEAMPSMLVNWPTKDEPEKVYKFASLWIE